MIGCLRMMLGGDGSYGCREVNVAIARDVMSSRLGVNEFYDR
jgi:hypothetical protein